MTDSSYSERYSERLTPAWWVWLVAAAFSAGIGLTVARLSALGGATVAVVTLAGLIVLLVRTTPELSVEPSVNNGILRAGRARVPLELTGDVHVLDAAAMRLAHGPGLDARAFLCLRGWITTGVRVDLTDPADPTPYWLISSRHPDRLSAAVIAARRASR
jgi:hypothetical protein